MQTDPPRSSHDSNRKVEASKSLLVRSKDEVEHDACQNPQPHNRRKRVGVTAGAEQPVLNDIASWKEWKQHSQEAKARGVCTNRGRWRMELAWDRWTLRPPSGRPRRTVGYGQGCQNEGDKTELDFLKFEQQTLSTRFEQRQDAQDQMFSQVMASQQAVVDTVVKMSQSLKIIQEAAMGPVVGPGFLTNVKEGSELLSDAQDAVEPVETGDEGGGKEEG